MQMKIFRQDPILEIFRKVGSPISPCATFKFKQSPIKIIYLSATTLTILFLSQMIFFKLLVDTHTGSENSVYLTSGSLKRFFENVPDILLFKERQASLQYKQ